MLFFNGYKKLAVSCFMCSFLLSSTVFAFNQAKPSWLTILEIGYNQYYDMLSKDGQYGALRIGFGRDLFVRKLTRLGLELSIETGNSMRINLPEKVVDEFGGLAFQLKLKPVIDLLLSSKMQFKDSRWSLLFKSGLALRFFQFERCSINDLQQVSPAIRVGFGYQQSHNYYIQLLYSVIVGKHFHYNFDKPSSHLVLSGVPSQNGVLLGATFFLDSMV